MRKLTLLFLAGLLPVSLLDAAFDAFLKIDGIDGESAVEGREGWIEVSAVTHGVTLPGNKLGDGGRLIPEHADVTIVKEVDKATPVLAFHCASGTPVGRAVLDFVRNDRETKSFYRVFLKDVTVRALVMDGAVEDRRPLEIVGIDFGYIEWAYTEFDEAGEEVEQIIAFWDLTKNEGGMLPGAGDPSLPPPGEPRFRAALSRIDGDPASAILTWNSEEEKTYGVYFSPKLGEPFDTHIATVPSEGNDTTSVDVELPGERGFFIIRELE